jgi:D-alanyl-D-alanine carboxypeptidase
MLAFRATLLGLLLAAAPDPNRFAASAFRRALAEAGIAVLGATGSTTDSLRYAPARRNRRFLIDSVGIDLTQFSLRDGSGLSHTNVRQVR